MGDGKTFSAHVEYAESDGPFSFINGPEFVDAGEAVAWARRHARRVVVRVGTAFFSAGEEPYRDAPAWPGRVSGQSNEGVRPVRRWQVEASTAWFRSDALEAAERLAEALRSEPGPADVARAASGMGGDGDPGDARRRLRRLLNPRARGPAGRRARDRLSRFVGI